MTADRAGLGRIGVDFGCPKCQTILNAKAANCDGPWHADNAPADPPWLEKAIGAAWAAARDNGWRSHTDAPTYAVDLDATQAMIRAALPHITGGMLEDARRAERRLRAALVANAHLLDVPFTSAPALSPWSRSINPALAALNEALRERAARQVTS